MPAGGSAIAGRLRGVVVALSLATVACDGPTEPGFPAYDAAALAHFEALAAPPPDMSSGMPLLRPPVVRKWRGAIRVASAGHPNPEDSAVLTAAVDEIRRATGRPVEIVTGTSAPANVVIHFLSRQEATALEPDLQPYHIGYFRTALSDYAIVSARVVIVSDEIGLDTRVYIVRHELMHVLGFPNHVGNEPSSVLHQPWAGATGFSDLDLTVMEMLYHPDVTPGMEVAEAARVLARVTVRDR